MGQQRLTEFADEMAASVFRKPPSFDANARALLERCGDVPRLFDIVRARMLARARTSIAVTGHSKSEASTPVRVLGFRFVTAILLLGVSVGVGTFVGATTALHDRKSAGVVVTPAHNLKPPPHVGAPVPQPWERKTSVVASSPSSTEGKRARPLALKHSSRVDELDLLQRTDAAYVSRDYAGALKLVSEHARRFPRAWFEEEREALRVRLLTESGRNVEARRAASDFAVRFPRSVFLSRLRETQVAVD